MRPYDDLPPHALARGSWRALARSAPRMISGAKTPRPRLTATRRLNAAPGIGLALGLGLWLTSTSLQAQVRVCESRAQLIWDGQRAHLETWRALCAPNAQALPQEYTMWMALPPVQLQISRGELIWPKPSPEAQPAIVQIVSEPKGAWRQTWLEHRRQKAYTTSDYILTELTIYQDAEGKSACKHAWASSTTHDIAQLKELTPLCNRGWLVLAAKFKRPANRPAHQEEETREAVGFIPGIDLAMITPDAQLNLTPGLTRVDDIVELVTTRGITHKIEDPCHSISGRILVKEDSRPALVTQGHYSPMNPKAGIWMRARLKRTSKDTSQGCGLHLSAGPEEAPAPSGPKPATRTPAPTRPRP